MPFTASQFHASVDTMFTTAGNSFTWKTDPFGFHRSAIAMTHWYASQHPTEVMAIISQKEAAGVAITWPVIIQAVFAALSAIFPGLGLLFTAIRGIITILIGTLPPVPTA